jgi:toxin ParE1/3/4
LKRPYVLAPAADRDVDECFLYIAERSREAAVRFLQALDTTLEKLAAMPELGQRQEFGRAELVEMRAWQVRGFENYVIFYRPMAGGIEVLRVLHAARDIPAFFDDPA